MVFRGCLTVIADGNVSGRVLWKAAGRRHRCTGPTPYNSPWFIAASDPRRIFLGRWPILIDSEFGECRFSNIDERLKEQVDQERCPWVR